MRDMNLVLPRRTPCSPTGRLRWHYQGNHLPAASAIPFHLSHESLHRMRVVIKVGTSLIAPGGQIDANLLRAMVDQFDLGKNEYLIVTSGAIAAGTSRRATRQPPRRGSARRAFCAGGP